MDDPFKMGMGGSQDSIPENEEGDGGIPAAQGEKNVVTLSADHFPPGIKPKDGDKLTFCVTGEPDDEGNVSGYFEASDGGEKSGKEDWDSHFTKSMSPVAPSEEAQ